VDNKTEQNLATSSASFAYSLFFIYLLISNINGCTTAIYSVRKIIEHFVNGGSTVNLCSIDLSKAFDKVNHHALFVKLITRHIPNELLSVLENWLGDCHTCVR